MPNEDRDARRGGDPRTVREKIADALIPRHMGFLKIAYVVLGDDRVLLRFLAIPEYDESRSLPLSGAPEDEGGADLLPFSPRHPR
jgi:hypothetical protein